MSSAGSNKALMELRRQLFLPRRNGQRFDSVFIFTQDGDFIELECLVTNMEHNLSKGTGKIEFDIQNAKLPGK